MSAVTPKTNTDNASSENNNPLIAKWSKETFSNINLSTIYEKKELQRLNSLLQMYLQGVKASENLNTSLISNLKTASESAFDLMDKSDLDKNLDEARCKLEHESNEATKHKIKLEENEDEVQHLSHRLKFFQNEKDLHKNKEFSLKSLLNDLQMQKENLITSNRLAEDDIVKELEKIFTAEANLAKLRKDLSDTRSKSKELEFEMQTILEDLAFRKAVHDEEVNYLRGKIPSSKAELNNFYKNELKKAVREIRQDFHSLNEQQLNDYKQFKENELNVAKFNMNQYKAIVEQQSTRLNEDLNSSSAKELHAGLNQNNAEIKQLNDESKVLLNRLNNLENQLKERKNLNADTILKLQNEIFKIKEQNSSYEYERNYLSQMIKTKLDFEIQVYRSILNCQGRVINGSSTSSPNLADIIQSISMSNKQSVSENSNYSSFNNSGSPNLLKILQSVSAYNQNSADSNNTSVAASVYANESDEEMSNVSSISKITTASSSTNAKS